MINIFELNLSKLNNVLFQPERTLRPKYLIMNHETRLAMENVPECAPGGLHGAYSTYGGIPVAVCNKLPFGKIDIID